MTSATTDRRLGLSGNTAIKTPVDLATTANITLSGEQTIDGTLTSSSRVLVKNQTNTVNNGIYDTSSGTWTRAIDANGNYDLVKGTLVRVTGGSANSGVFYEITSPSPTIGTSVIVWSAALADSSTTLSFQQSGLGAVVRSAQDKMRDAVHVKDYGAVLDGTTNDTTAILAAVAANQGTSKTLIWDGPAKVTASVVITARLCIDFCDRRGQLLMATQNMNGIVIGDGTSLTRTALFGTSLLAPAFAPFPGVAQSSSGACIYENYVAVVDVIRPSFYGKDAGVRKLFNGLVQFQCIQCDTPYILGQEMHGDIVSTSGGAGVLRMVDCNYDNARLINSDGNGVTWGAFSEGLGMYRAEAYGLTGWALKIDAGSGLNFFLTDPDFEIDPTSSGGIWAKTGTGLMITGGWCGASSISGTLPIGVQADSGFNGVDICFAEAYAIRIILNGPVGRVTGGLYTSDTATAGVGITLGAVDCQVSSSVTIRQYAGTAIGFSGTPAGLLIGDVKFKSNGTDIASLAGFSALAGPVIGNVQTDAARTGYTAATTTAIPITVNFAQITGTTNITTIPAQGVGSHLTIQATGSTVNLVAGGNLALKSAPVAVTSGQAIHLKCDGAVWFEVGRTF